MSKWLTYSPKSGHGDGIITITASTLSELDERVANITVFNDYYSKSATTNVTQMQTPTGYASYYTTLQILTGGTIGVKSDRLPGYNSFEYSMDNGITWNDMILKTGETEYINVSSGDKILFRDDIRPTDLIFYGTAKYELYGNILSLYYGSDFIYHNKFPFAANNPKKVYFSGSSVVSAENFVLYPKTLLSEEYINEEISGDTLVTVTSATEYNYGDMFKNCSELITPPKILPATTLTDSCYFNMFADSGLKSLPELPATTLAPYCYRAMFANTKINSAQSLVLPASTLVEGCYMNMFDSCQLLLITPTLSATTLAQYCYLQMFYFCPILNYVKCLATDISAEGCVENWLAYTAQNGTFVKSSSMNNWPTGSSGIPSGWTVQNA